MTKNKKPGRAAWGTARVVVLAQEERIRDRLLQGWPVTRIYVEDFDGEKCGVCYGQFRKMVNEEIGSRSQLMRESAKRVHQPATTPTPTGQPLNQAGTTIRHGENRRDDQAGRPLRGIVRHIHNPDPDDILK